MDKLTKNVNELFRLRKLLKKYSHRYYDAIEHDREPSQRIYNWIDAYNEFKDIGAWIVYCRDNHLAIDHDAYDLFA